MKKQRRLIFIIAPTMMLIFFCLFAYKLVWLTSLSTEMKALAALWIFIVVGTVFAMPLFFWTKPDRGETKIEIYIQKAGNYAQGYFSYILALVMFRDFLWLATAYKNESLVQYNTEELIFILIAPAFLMFIGRIVVARGPFIKKVELRSETGFSRPIKMVQISDLHIGPGLSLKKIKSIVERANEQAPDFIFLTGDMVDHLDKWFVHEINELGNLKAKHGVFFITGNHEYYWGAGPIINKIKNLGIQVLLNENQIVNLNGKKILIAGTTDFAAEYFSLEGPNLEKAMLGGDDCDYKILLSHQPKLADQTAALQKSRTIPKIDLMLSGHTHGGQFIPWSLMIRLFQKYSKGLYKFKINEKHSMKLYVSQGTGFWGPPDRLGTKSELTVLSIH